MRIINFSGGSTIEAFKITYNRQYLRGKRRARALGPAGAELLTVWAVMELYILQQLGDMAASVHQHCSLVVNQERSSVKCR